jgi:hypothetical protein
MNRRPWLILFFVCVVALFVSFALPSSMGETPAMIGGIAMILGLSALIVFIVSGIKAKHKPKVDPALTAALSAQYKPVKPPVPAPSADPAPQPPAPVPEPKKATTTERIHVRGLDHYTDNIKAVARENPDYDLTKHELIEECPDEKVWQYYFNVNGDLVPEPDNPYDPNAIMVQANGLCIGHVPKGSTSHIRKLMESGRIQSMHLDIGGGKYKEVYEDEDDKYEMDRGERPFSAVLELYLTEETNTEATL